MNEFSLFKKGCLGTCWYGKYHYMEPWVGCSHNCPYCYARFREVVCDKLKSVGTAFENPKTFMEPELLLKEIEKGIVSENIEILKLSRFTDIFIPEFIKTGLTFEILKILANSKVRRIIITTKGVPDSQIIALISSFKDKFSYNVALRPKNDIDFKESIPSIEEKIEVAAEINSAGVLTTLHLDPFIANFDDGPELEILLDLAKKKGIKRAMFSYLLVSDEILRQISEVIELKIFEKFKENYNFNLSREYLKGQKDTYYYTLKDNVKKMSVERTSELLSKKGFDFVLCSLKSTPGLDITKFRGTNLCDGKFYA